MMHPWNIQLANAWCCDHGLLVILNEKDSLPQSLVVVGLRGIGLALA
jgi:hypothetical protein